MNKTFVVFIGSERAYIDWIKAGQPSDDPADVPFGLPETIGAGDRYLAYVGGKDQVYVGCGMTLTDWYLGSSGAWKGVDRIDEEFHSLRNPVSAADVEKRTGFLPRRTGEIDPAIAGEVWRAARRIKPANVDSATEGLVTEAKSKKRNAALRQAARARAGDRCAACDTDFSQVAGGLGRRCLVVHHTKQLRDRDQPDETDLSDLVVVCANCHMMIHANSTKALSVGELRRRLEVTDSVAKTRLTDRM